VDMDFEIIFWSCVREDNLPPRIAYIREKVPGLPEDCLQFGQSLCRVSAYRDPTAPSKPFFFKPLARLFERSPELRERGANEGNTLLIDDSPYKNLLNNPLMSFTHLPILCIRR